MSSEVCADVSAATEVLAACALEVIARRFPHKLDHLIQHPGDLCLPSEAHPLFDGSYDWHSAVHMHWSLLRLRAIGVAPATRAAIERRFAAVFTPQAVAQELAYVQAPGRGGFERPYGWAWLLKLQQELDLQGAQGSDARAWAQALSPLTEVLAQRLSQYLEHLHYPIRAGTHANTAFSLLLALDYARTAGHAHLLDCIPRRARHWFGTDRDYPARYEPSGSDFLSAGLCEALLMQRVLSPDEFAAWWARFCPADCSAWLTPAVVSDRLDAQTVHLDGLNLSRAWCLRGVAQGLASGADTGDVSSAALHAAAQAHWDAAWPHVTGGDFVATHWLVSFALLR